MREILFRAKTIVNESKWVEGFYVHIPCGRFLCDEHDIQTIEEDGRIGQLFTVYESTLGQFTGLTDKNGKKAFEHDITEDGWGRRWLIFACDGGFGIRRNSEWSRNDPIYNALADAQNATWFKDNHTIIGNIHDNPELLGG